MYHLMYLKSSLDRFIDIRDYVVRMLSINLKSSLDRFIEKTN